MPATFDGDNLIITLPSGVTNISAQVDLYSDWKEWVKTGDNMKYPIAFETSGGEPVVEGDIYTGRYYFLRNDLGWRIRPPEEDITIYIAGNLTPKDSTLPIGIPTIGNYTALLISLQPITQEKVIGGGGDAPTVEEIDAQLSSTHGASSWEGATTAQIDAVLSAAHGAGSWEGDTVTLGEIKDQVDKIDKAATIGPAAVVTGSLMDRIMNKDAKKTYNQATDSLEAKKDRIG